MTRTVLETLRRLIRTNSVNPSYEQGQPEAAMASYVADFWREHEIETWKQDVFPGRPNIMARIEGEQPGKRIVFERASINEPSATCTIPPRLLMTPLV